MTLARVYITAEAYQVCTIHALSTESEEIMGLLLGSFQVTGSGEPVARIWAVLPQIRADRRKDRVEASPEQLAKSSAVAEQLSAETGTHTQVIGWYHSHPHIPVLPSHVDVRTQAIYQMMDERFVGLIWSVFNTDPQGALSMQVVAFQSVPADTQPASPYTPVAADSPLARALSLSRKDLRAAAVSDMPMMRADIPLDIVPATGRAERESVRDLGVLMRMLIEEERQELQSHVEDARDGEGRVPMLVAMHHAAVYQQRMARLLDAVVCPVLHMLTSLPHQRNLQEQQQKALDSMQPPRMHKFANRREPPSTAPSAGATARDAWVNEPGHSQFIQEAHQQPAASSDMPSQPLQSVQLSYVGYKPGSQAPQAHDGDAASDDRPQNASQSEHPGWHFFNHASADLYLPVDANAVDTAAAAPWHAIGNSIELATQQQSSNFPPEALHSRPSKQPPSAQQQQWQHAHQHVSSFEGGPGRSLHSTPQHELGYLGAGLSADDSRGSVRGSVDHDTRGSPAAEPIASSAPDLPLHLRGLQLRTPHALTNSQDVKAAPAQAQDADPFAALLGPHFRASRPG